MRLNGKKLTLSGRLPGLLACAILLIFLFTIPQITAQDSDNVLSVSTTNSGIPSLVGSNGHTLYTFSRDTANQSACVDECTLNWIPLLLDSTVPLAFDSEEVTGQVGTLQRPDGSTQLSYNGWPLYYYSGDAAPGDDSGHGVRDLWFAANPAHVMLSPDGNFLIGPGGLTLYIFTEDEGNTSFCLDECAVQWPPLLVQPGTTPVLGANLNGTLASFQRPDGSTQLSYNGWPLYFYHEDEAPGDVTGDGVKDVWFVADINREPLEVTPPPAASATGTALATAVNTVAPPPATTALGGEETPELTPEQTPEVTPEQTPESTPELTPEMTPETTSTP